MPSNLLPIGREVSIGGCMWVDTRVQRETPKISKEATKYLNKLEDRVYEEQIHYSYKNNAYWRERP